MSYKCFYGFGDMLIGSKKPPQADIIKFVITGGDPRVARYCCWQRSSFFHTHEVMLGRGRAHGHNTKTYL